MGQLTNQYVSGSYQGLIKLTDSSQGVTSDLQRLEDGLGNDLPIQISSTEAEITGSFYGDGSGLTGITFDTSSIDARIDSKLDSSSFENYSSSNDSKVNSLINATGSYLTDLPDGLVSGSSQISYTGLSDIPNGIVSGSGQISFNSISDVPDGLISGSIQISDLGYATTGSNTFNGDQIISGALDVTGDITGNLIGSASYATTSSFALNAIDKSQNVLLKEPTGFESPENVIITYDSVNRTITLTGTINAYYQGEKVDILTSGWVSDPHPNVTEHTYFLNYNGSGFVWTEDIFPGFYNLLIAQVYFRATNPFAVRECHGFQQWESHQNDHYNIGTYRTSGGDISNLVLSSITPDNRRPIISACTVYDEDLKTINPELTTKKYSQRYLSGTSTINYNLQSNDIVPLLVNNPYYNNFNGTIYEQVLMPANSIMTVWLYEVPVTSDSTSQEIRHVFVQGQSFTQAANSSAGALLTARNAERAKTTLELNLGVPQSVSQEYVAIQKFLVQYTAGDWSIVESIKITGSKASQVGSPSGNYLTSVTADTTLTGDGSTTSPLGIRDVAQYATTGSNTFNGNQIIRGSIEPTTIKGSSESSGNVWIDFNNDSVGCTTPNPHLNQLTNGVNVILPRRPEITSICTGSIEVSGSSNIILQGHLVDQPGRKGYLPGYGNIVQNLPTINTSSLATITMANNFISTPPSLNYNTGTHTITGNMLVGATNLNHVSASASPVGSSMLNNINAGTIISNASGSALTGQLQINNNLQAGTVTLRHIKSPIRYMNNMEVGNITVNNNFEGTGSNHYFDFSNNFIGVSSGIIDVSGSTATNVRRRVNDNFIGGNNVYLQLNESGSDAGDISSTLIFGNSLNVYGKQTLNGLDKGSAYLGRYNLDSGPTADPRQTIVAVGTGTSIANRKTGFWIKSDSTVGVDGAMNVTGSLTLNGNIYQTGTVNTSDDFVYLRNGSTVGLSGPTDYSGFVIKNINGTNDAKIGVDSQGWLYAGRIGEEQRMAPIVYSPTNNYLAYWDSGNGNLNFIDQNTFAPANGSINNNFDTNDLFVAGTFSSSNPISGTFTGDGTGLSITLPNGLVSGSSQISYTGITDVPSGLVSGSSQIELTGTTGFSTFSSSVSKDNIYQLYQPDKTNPFVYTDNSGALHIDGNIIQNGSSYETHAEKIYSTKDYIYLRSGSVAGLGAGEYTGIEAEKYDGVNNGRLVFDNQGWAKVGDAGSEQTLATRIDTPTNGYMAVWDDANKRLDFVQQYQLPSGVVSGSGQISFNGITDKPTLISGSAQVNVAQTTGYSTLSTTGSNTFVGSQVISGSLQGKVEAISISSNTGSLNCDNTNFFTLQLPSGSTTFINPTNIKPGRTISVKINTLGPATVNFPTSVKQPSGSAYVPTTSGTDIITLVSFDTTTIYVAAVNKLI